MTCECVTVDYPSTRLLPLVDAAIAACRTELKLTEQRMSDRVSEYEALPWNKRLFKTHPDRGMICHNWDDSLTASRYRKILTEFKQVKLVAEVSETVRISGDCLARIDGWAGN